jgi:hypothetical protein
MAFAVDIWDNSQAVAIFLTWMIHTPRSYATKLESPPPSSATRARCSAARAARRFKFKDPKRAAHGVTPGAGPTAMDWPSYVPEGMAILNLLAKYPNGMSRLIKHLRQPADPTGWRSARQCELRGTFTYVFKTKWKHNSFGKPQNQIY